MRNEGASSTCATVAGRLAILGSARRPGIEIIAEPVRFSSFIARCRWPTGRLFGVKKKWDTNIALAPSSIGGVATPIFQTALVSSSSFSVPISTVFCSLVVVDIDHGMLISSCGAVLCLGKLNYLRAGLILKPTVFQCVVDLRVTLSFSNRATTWIQVISWWSLPLQSFRTIPTSCWVTRCLITLTFGV